MAKYNITFSCGHTATISLFGKESDRQRKIAWYEENGICPECYKKKIAAERQAAADEAEVAAKEMGLPELEGSEKQVAWANTIRGSIVKEVNECLNNAYKEQKKAEKEGREALLKNIKRVIDLLNAINEVIASETSAHKIIDWRGSIHIEDWCYKYQRNYDNLISGRMTPDDMRDGYDAELFGRALDLLLGGRKPEQKAEEAEESEETETVVLSPEHKESDTLVKVIFTDKEVSVESPKDSGVIDTVKSCGFRWDGDTWMMQIGVKTGSAVDRAAEIANKLLLAGYQVTVPASISQAAVSGNYNPRCMRWVFGRSGDPDHVYVSWGRDEDLYYKVKSIAGAKWIPDLHYIRIPASSADEIEDFAAINGFQISPGAAKILDGYRKSVQIVTPAEKPEEKPQDESEKLNRILNSSREVIEDLKDDN